MLTKPSHWWMYVRLPAACGSSGGMSPALGLRVQETQLDAPFFLHSLARVTGFSVNAGWLDIETTHGENLDFLIFIVLLQWFYYSCCITSYKFAKNALKNLIALSSQCWWPWSLPFTSQEHEVMPHFTDAWSRAPSTGLLGGPRTISSGFSRVVHAYYWKCKLELNI